VAVPEKERGRITVGRKKETVVNFPREGGEEIKGGGRTKVKMQQTMPGTGEGRLEGGRGNRWFRWKSSAQRGQNAQSAGGGRGVYFSLKQWALL